MPLQSSNEYLPWLYLFTTIESMIYSSGFKETTFGLDCTGEIDLSTSSYKSSRFRIIGLFPYMNSKYGTIKGMKPGQTLGPVP